MSSDAINQAKNQESSQNEVKKEKKEEKTMEKKAPMICLDDIQRYSDLKNKLNDIETNSSKFYKMRKACDHSGTPRLTLDLAGVKNAQSSIVHDVDVQKAVLDVVIQHYEKMTETIQKDIEAMLIG